MLLKWQSLILNNLYKTKKFNEIIQPNMTVKQLNYERLFNIQELKPHFQSLVESANTIVKPHMEKQVLQKKIQFLNEIVRDFGEEENINHVVVYSCLSKCRIWPKILKCGRGFVPQLIDFYNGFTERHQNELDFKFDPVILTKKHTKIMKKHQHKKKDHPNLVKAIMNNDITIIQEILNQMKVKILKNGIPEQNLMEVLKQQLNYVEHDQKHLSHICVESSNLQTIQFFWKQGIDFEALDKQEQTALFYATKRGCLKILEFLVEKVKVNINHKEYFDRTAFYLAAFEGYLDVIQYLHSHGANPEIESKQGRTPLSKACYLGNVKVVEFLVNVLQVELIKRDSKGRTALHNAVWGIEGGRDGKRRGNIQLQDSPESAQILMKAGHPLEIEDYDGFTPLFSAVSSNAVKSVRLLKKYKANFEHKTHRGETCVFIAAKYGHLEMIRLLIEEYGLDYQTPDINGYSPLAAAFTLEQDHSFEYLINVYYESNIPINLPSLMQCLNSYTPKAPNLKYLLKWAEKPQHAKYLFLQMQQRNQFDIFLSQQSHFHLMNELFLLLLEASGDQMDYFLIKEYVNQCSKKFVRGKFPEFLRFISRVKDVREVELQNLSISWWVGQKTILQVLELDSNLTNTTANLINTLRAIVAHRMTGLLLGIFEHLEHPPKPTGIYRYSKQQIMNILNKSQSNQQTILNLCSLQGINDIAHILKHQHSQHMVMPSIPYYEYQTVPFDNISIELKAADPEILSNEGIFNWLSEAELTKYKTPYVPSNSYIMVDNPHVFQILEGSVSKSNLIGIDVEHFSLKHEKFVCLVQVATAEGVFLIDALERGMGDLNKFFTTLFSDKSKIKLFHAYDHDLKWIHEDFGLDAPLNSVLDTSKINMEIHNTTTSISLKNLALQELDFEMQKDYQKSDWRLRPLFRQMIDYAAIDAEILPFIFIKQLQSVKDAKITQSFFHNKTIKSKGVRNIVNRVEKKQKKQQQPEKTEEIHQDVSI